MTMMKITGFIGIGVLSLAAIAGRPQEDGEAAKLLDDRSQPWWNGHRPPKVKGPVSYNMSPSNDLGAREDAPIYTAQMPPKVAAALLAGWKAPEGHPFAGRPVVLLDVRRGVEFLAERIKGTTSSPAVLLEASLENGPLSKMDRKTVMVVFGSRWPHFNVVSGLKAAKFEAVYAMEGLHGWKAAGLPIERDEKLIEFLKVAEKEPVKGVTEVVPEPPNLPPVPGVDPLALKILMDSGVDLYGLFVGDRSTYEDGHVPGAFHVPVAQLPEKLAKMDRNRLMIVMCGCCQGKRGGPSENALAKLKEMGFTRVLHLDGHMYAWKVAGLPVEHEDPPPRK